MSELVLVLNAGSSSLKFSLYSMTEAEPALQFRGQVEGIGTRTRFAARAAAGAVIDERQWPDQEPLDHAHATDFVLTWIAGQTGNAPLAGIGHRVVHGGMEFTGPVRITDDVVRRLRGFIPLAPLHQPHNLAPIEAILRKAPELPQVACFDTSFHRSQAAVAQAFALPPEITDRGVHRFGFHGLSYEYVAAQLPGLDARGAAGRTVVAHLGNGASMCAVAAGRSVASTMGFTALDGLPMGTRCGSIDPGVVLYLMDELHMTPREIEKLLYHRSGLLGVSGISSDMRALLASSEPRAAAAVELFVYRIVREIGSLAAALGGLDCLVFTAGIGENSAEVRARVCRQSAWLGVAIDEEANTAGGPRISREDSAVSVWVVPTNEESMIVRHVRAVLGR